MIELDSKAKPIAFAWPGGYPIFYFARTGYRNNETGELELSRFDRDEFVCCPECAKQAKVLEIVLIESDVHWEGEPLSCELCDGEIESAYGEI